MCIVVVPRQITIRKRKRHSSAYLGKRQEGIESEFGEVGVASQRGDMRETSQVANRAQLSCKFYDRIQQLDISFSGSEMVAMMQTAQSRHRHDAAARAGGDFCLASSGRLFWKVAQV